MTERYSCCKINFARLASTWPFWAVDPKRIHSGFRQPHGSSAQAMLTLLNISNVALIDNLRVEFEPGLNLLTGETGSGKSIIVDALGLLIGGRFSPDMLKAGETAASVEGLFSIQPISELVELLTAAGIDPDGGELIVRREFSAAGRSKVFVNNRLVTGSTLRDLRPFLVDIHGQGDQQTLFNPETHLDLLDSYAGAESLRDEISSLYRRLQDVKSQLSEQQRDEAGRFQLVDILRFQIDELERAALTIGEDERLEEERRRLNNIEKLSRICADALAITYDDADSGLGRVGQAMKKVEELTEYESSFRSYIEGLRAASAVLEDLAFALRDFGEKLEFSPSRQAEVDNRLAELQRLKRKYGGSVESALEHLARSQDRLRNIEYSDERETHLKEEVKVALADYLDVARRLREKRIGAIEKFSRAVERSLAEVAMDNARFEVHIDMSPDLENPASSLEAASESKLTARGMDDVEFFFSANVGEPPRRLAKVASGGEASRLMLVLKTAANASRFPRTIVFDEVDSGIGGRVAEAVGAKLKRLSETNQVLCVTHQAQIARFAKRHLLLQKQAVGGRTEIAVETLDMRSRVEEIARMLTGAEITQSARRHAEELLKTT
jgi:DNA repair protein RecN (Recombination protein N)